MNMPEESIIATTFIELLRKMGHDMRAPLGSIISTSDMLAEGVYDTLTPKQVRANDRMRRNSRRVLAILDDFVTYVKADAGQIDLTAKPFDPRASLSDWCGQTKSVCGEKGLVLYLTTEKCVPAHLIGDTTVISKAILPLLWNAVAFTSEGSIWVESDWSSDHTWHISVRDSGVGIPADHIPHIFDPFWRGEERPQVATAGAGLGLPMSLSLVKLMKGRLMLKETSSQGSTFCLELPLIMTDN